MNSLDFTKKYTGLSNVKVVNSLTEVTGIDNQEFTVIQHGQRWHSRLSCWIKDSARSFFSPLRKNTTNAAWEQLGQDLSEDGAIDTNEKQLAQTKIKRWQKEGVPLRVLHVRQLLRQVDQDFSSRPPTNLRGELNNYRPDDGEKFSFKVSLSSRTESTEEIWKMEPLSNEERTVGAQEFMGLTQSVDSENQATNSGTQSLEASEDSDTSAEDSSQSTSVKILDPAQTEGTEGSETLSLKEQQFSAALSNVFKDSDDSTQQTANLTKAMESFAPSFQNHSPDPESETPKLDDVAQQFVTEGGSWATPDIYEAVVELLNKDEIEVTDKFKQAGNSKQAYDNKSALVKDVMTKFHEIAEPKENVRGGKKFSGMTAEEFKSDFKKASSEVAYAKANWFKRVEDDWDPNVTDL